MNFSAACGGGLLFDEIDVVGDTGGLCLCFIPGGFFFPFFPPISYKDSAVRLKWLAKGSIQSMDG